MSIRRDPPADIESVYALSPMQEGMLFHTLLRPSSGVYLMQNRYRLEGDIRTSEFVSGWQEVVARHPMLRTSFAWKSQKRPLQIVQKTVKLPFDVLDWRGLTEEAQEARLAVELRAELDAGFDFARAPLMRFRLIRLSEQTYEFVHSFHHILLDEWCTSLLMMDFLAHYEALIRGEKLLLPPARPYRDYIDWLGRQDLKAAEAFWRGNLEGFASPTPLGIAELSAPAGEGEGEVEDLVVRLDAAPTAALFALAQRNRLTLNTVVQGAWALLLSHYSSASEVTFGVTVAGRPPELPEVESIAGLFINTLPLRVAVPADRPLLGWLAALFARNLELRQYEYTPLVDIQRWSEVERGQALFQSLFVFENAPMDPALREGRIVFRVQQVRDRVHTNYPITVMSWPEAELPLKISYDRSRVTPEVAARLLEHFKTILEGMAARPEARLGDLLMLTPAERRQALGAWNATSGGKADFSSYAALFHAQVARTPDSIAVSCGARQLTYAELNRAANRVAHALLALGVRPEDRVVLLDERGIDLLTMILAVFKAGGAYVPLEPTYPGERVARIVELCAPRVLLTRDCYRNGLEAALSTLDGPRRPTVLTLDDVLRASFAEDDPAERGGPNHLAYVIYTSGSTGVPKGAMVERRGMLNNMLSKLPRLGLEPGDVIAQTASPCFDISVWQFLTALLFGGVVDIVPDEIARDPGRLLAHVESRGIRVIEVVPAVLQGMLEAAVEQPEPPTLRALRWILPTGEALPVALVRAWLTRYPAVPLMNAYGPAECSDDVALHPLTTPPHADDTQVPIGRPVDHLRLYVLDHLLEPTPVGVCGEIYVGGLGVGRGYLGDPRRTAAVFLPDPFSDEPGCRLYRTGDLGRYGSDGTITFAGRRDHQLKLRGYRIEPGEIESRLAEQGAVQEAVVVVREDRPGVKRLVAYVALSGAASAEELRAWLSARLPDYMVPPSFVFLPGLPRTANGKLDRRALPVPESGDVLAFVAPRSGTEELLAGIWADVLDTPRVGVEDSFFDLGGHSLLLTQVLVRVRKVFGVEPPLRALFETPTVAAQARAIEVARGNPAGPPAPPLVAVPRQGPLPLSFAQERLWFLAQLEPTAASYNIPAAVHLAGQVDVVRLERALDAVVRRHDSLRTTFAENEGLPVTVVQAVQPVNLAIIDVREANGASEVRRLLAEEASRPFDLTTGPLFRATLLRTGQLEHILILVIHHIVSDGWSMNVLVGELTELYAADMDGRSPALAALPVQYADYARWQREWLEGPVFDQQLAYWRQKLAGEAPVLALPLDRPRPAAQSFRGARYAFTLPSKLSIELTALARKQGVTPFMLLLAGFQALLARYSSQTDIWVGTPIANRTRAEVQDLVGFFVNTLVLRADLSDNPRFVDLLARSREAVLGAQTHQDLPFEQLVEALRPARDLSRTPLFQVMFSLQQMRARTRPMPGVEVRPYEVFPGSAQFDLSLDMALQNNELSGLFEYSTDLFDEATIERLAAHLQQVLEGVVANPRARFSELPLLTPAEQRQALVEWNATSPSAPNPNFASYAALFHAQVDRTPDAVAVSCGDRRLTYAELNRDANRVAHALIAHGIGPEQRVALLDERGIELLTMILAVFKAGGAYVPLEPTYPAERRERILSSSQPRVLLTRERYREGLASVPEARTIVTIEGVFAGAWPLDNPAENGGADHLAYVIYTSGSTGVPKGAMVERRGMLNNMLSKIPRFELRPGDVVAQTASPCFDISVWQFLTALLFGGVVDIVPDAIVRDPGRLLDHAERRGITLLEVVPAVLQAMLEAAREQPTPPTLERLRWILPTGEALPVALVRAWLSHFPTVPLMNAYGPAECSDDVALHPLTAPPPAHQSHVPIGRPVDHLRLYVLDPFLAPLPVGACGELYVGGIGVGRGYLGDPCRTAAAFIPDPFSQEPGRRLYRTGDLGRYRNDGAIEFVGRRDHQVKIRGFRIELGEIESRLGEHEAVQEVAVLAREDRPGVKRLVAYVMSSSATLEAQDLRAWLQTRLPDYMVPPSFVFLPALPRTTNGKLDRTRLPAPEHASDVVPTEPRTAAEAQLAKIWAAVLGRDQIGINENFFEVGGDSILSLQVASRARQAGLDLTPRQIFQHQTIAELAAVAGTALSVAPASQGPVTGAAPLTPIQRSFFAQSLPNPHHWNQALLLVSSEPLDWAAVETAVPALLRHHDALRLRYTPEGTGFRQVHTPHELSTVVHREDLSAIPAGEQAEALAACAARWQASLSLTEGPLVRVIGFELGAGQRERLLVIVHHLVVDGVSWQILLEDLQTACDQYRSKEPIQLPSKTTSFKQWAERLEKAAQDPRFQQEAAFWLDLPWEQVIAPPVDEPLGERTEATMVELTVGLDEAETRALLEAVPEAYRTRIDEVLLCALALALGRWTGAGVVAVDVEGHGREALDGEEVDLSRTVGWFTNVFPVVLELAPSTPPGTALKSVKEQLRRLPRRGLPYGVVRELGSGDIAERLRQLPTVSIGFNYLGQWDQVIGARARWSVASESSGPEHDPRSPLTYELEIDAAVYDGRLEATFRYSAARYRRATVAAVAAWWRDALQELIAHCLSPDAGAVAPSDFPDVALAPHELTALLEQMD